MGYNINTSLFTEITVTLKTIIIRNYCIKHKSLKCHCRMIVIISFIGSLLTRSKLVLRSKRSLLKEELLEMQICSEI